ncbi:hypothetical protein INS49_013170 [Diaporthe citri]|uniref:uncharacterized protein n=1 Tax=Diaporthe citri TaxID=83186 RepID=UPI001C816B08|nr:uncharacterized protein INS49_013170 [Diaporthe citri]KAG6359647.1 hypothetical protein INS49_013170 [Diaporthe citri]
MSTWLQDGKSAIQEALVDAFNKIEEGAKAELQERDRRHEELLGELRRLQDHAANATQLQRDNESLRKQLQELLESHQAPETTPPKKRLPLGELSPNKLAASRTATPGSRLGAEAVDYEKEYNKLHAKYNILEKSRDKYKSVLRQRIEQIDKWAEASDKQKAIIERLRKRLAQCQSKNFSEVHADTAGIGPLTDDERLDVSVDEPRRPSPDSSFESSTNAARDPSTCLTISRYANTGAQTGTEDPGNLTEDVYEAITPENGPGNIRNSDRAPASHEAVARTSASGNPNEQQPHSRTVFHLGLGIRDLAEDGDADMTTVQRRVAKGRLDALLNSPSVRTPKPKIQPASHRVQGLQPAPEDDLDDALRVPARRELPHGKKLSPKEILATPVQQKAASATPNKTNSARGRAPKRPSIIRDDMPRGRLTDREKVPLRQRQMDTLRPEDFKPNPSHNDGLTYVYDEVVRGREARSALSGCTDLNCCGKTFRSFAKAERSTIGPSVTTRAEDIKLLENYLGDDAYKLGSMTRDEKEETWLLAKTWELSSKFGRHRQRYSRMPSPPGFWTVEFPSTQERAEERRQGEEIQKALVNERYREAMRPGGRWLFRDEDGR